MNDKFGRHVPGSDKRTTYHLTREQAAMIEVLCQQLAPLFSKRYQVVNLALRIGITYLMDSEYANMVKGLPASGAEAVEEAIHPDQDTADQETGDQ